MPPVQLFATCLGDLVLPEAVADAETLLREAGFEVDFPRGQVCCGVPLLILIASPSRNTRRAPSDVAVLTVPRTPKKGIVTEYRCRRRDSGRSSLHSAAALSWY